MHIKQVATFFALIKRSEFCSKEFFNSERLDIARARKPSIRYREWDFDVPKYGEMFLAVGLDFDFYGDYRWDCGFGLEAQRIVERLLDTLHIGQEGKNFLQPIEGLPEWCGSDLNEVDVFRLANLWGKVELVQSCSAPKRKAISKEIIREYGNQGS